MQEYIFRLYNLVHLGVKKILRRKVLSVNSNLLSLSHHRVGVQTNPAEIWLEFIDNSRINSSEPFKGFHYTGFILEKGQWCLPSWIWTDAALVRMYVVYGNFQDARILCNNLLGLQQDCGGWIVRNDYDSKGAIPMLAPNDSSYIANNAFLSMYSATHDKMYLNAAIRCANWIIESAREDAMVYTGYNVRDGKWDKEHIIVDVGFTAALFANLTEITNNKVYRDFLKRFINRYIDLFFDPDFNGFSTSINKSNHRQGGFFGRGQAWALEGLIPAYRVLKDQRIKEIIEKTVNNLVNRQNKDGSWPYNLSRKLMGNDCKGVPVIAKSIVEWYLITNDQRLPVVIMRAYKWCCKHTCVEGEARGGIFSFCTEGAVVKDLYSSCAFVYASAYAIEIDKFFKRHK